MTPLKIVLGSNIRQTILIFQEAAQVVPFEVIAEQTFEDFLLTIQERAYHAVAFDFRIRSDIDPIKTIRLIRQMRPRVPLLVIADIVDKKTGSQIMNEGVLHILSTPLTKENVKDALIAVFNIIKLKAERGVP